MRTKLDLDDDSLARHALAPKSATRIRNGVPLFEPQPGVRKPHLALVNRLRDEGCSPPPHFLKNSDTAMAKPIEITMRRTVVRPRRRARPAML